MKTFLDLSSRGSQFIREMFKNGDRDALQLYGFWAAAGALGIIYEEYSRIRELQIRQRHVCHPASLRSGLSGKNTNSSFSPYVPFMCRMRCIVLTESIVCDKMDPTSTKIILSAIQKEGKT